MNSRVGNHFGADEAALEVGVDAPAACRAFVPRRIVQARTSSGPTVKNEIRSSSP